MNTAREASHHLCRALRIDAILRKLNLLICKVQYVAIVVFDVPRTYGVDTERIEEGREDGNG